MCLFCGPSGRAPLDYRAQQAQPLTTADKLAGPADVILRGGPILTMDPSRPEATALSLRQGLIQIVGSVDEAMSRKGRMTRVIDLDGRVVLPGFVLADLPKDPVDFLDWQMLEGLTEGDVTPEGLSARGIMPSMFGEPVLVRVESLGGEDAPDRAPLLAALAELCKGAPMAVALPQGLGGFVNQALRRRTGQCGGGMDYGVDGFTPVADLPALLRPAAEAQEFSPRAVARVLAARIGAASAEGYTTLVDRRMGSVAGRNEIDAATDILERSRCIRLHGAASTRLRQEWDGTLPEDLPPGRLRIDAASVDLGEHASYLESELSALNRAGWRMTFNAGSDEELERLLPILSNLKQDAERDFGTHRIEASFVPGAARRRAIEVLGLTLAVEPEADGSSEHGNAGDAAGLSVSERLLALTAGAARLRGLQDIAGMIGVGRCADFTFLDGEAFQNGELRVSGTWLDGAPV